MGLIVLHAGHNADLFKKLMGTSCKHKWREANDHERLWVVAPGHPIAAGLGEYVDIGPEEMYGEHFDVLPAEALVFVGWFSGGEVFRSGCSCQHTLQTISMPSPLLSSDASELPSDTMPTAPILICLAHIALALGDQERVTKLYPRLLSFHGQHYLFLVDRILGEMATLCEDWKAARMHLTAANAVAQRKDLRHELARTLLAQADFEVACGGQGSEIRARDMLNLALVLLKNKT